MSIEFNSFAVVQPLRALDYCPAQDNPPPMALTGNKAQI